MNPGVNERKPAATKTHMRSGKFFCAPCAFLWQTLLLRFRMPDIAFAVAEPAARRYLLLREELHAFLALHV